MSKPTDLESHIKKQLSRMAHFSGFPETPEAIRDYISAIAVCGTQEGVNRLMDEITATEWEWCPTAARVRSLAWEQVERERGPQQNDCAICDGTGWRQVIRGGLSGVTECACRKVSVACP